MELIILLLIVIGLVIVGAAVLGAVLSLVWWAIIGLVIGALARVIVPGTEGLGLLITALSGIAGALLGGVIANALDVGSLLEFAIAVLVAAAIVAMLAARRPAGAATR